MYLKRSWQYNNELGKRKYALIKKNRKMYFHKEFICNEFVDSQKSIIYKEQSYEINIK